MKYVMSFSMVCVLAASAGCNPIVDLGCEQGYEACDGVCVRLDDPMNCGGCGVVCATPECRAGVCASGEVGDGSWMVDAATQGDAGTVVPDDAATTTTDAADASTDDATTVIGDTGTTSTDDAAITSTDDAASDFDAAIDPTSDAAVDPTGDAAVDPDAGPSVPACDIGESLCDTSCVRLDSDPTHCGACGVRCGATEVCSSGVCASICGPGLTLCNRRCVDTTTSASDCGGCGVTCETGICESSSCIAGYAGHLVVIAHDYAAARGPMYTLLSNALGLSAASSTPRVLHYAGAASSDSVAGIASALTHTRPVISSLVVDPLDVPLALASADVFLVYPQHDANDDDLDVLGTSWSRALATFLARGGAVIALDAMCAGNVDGAARWLSAAGLANDVPHEDASGSVLTVVAPADALVVGLPLSYRAETYSARWLGSDLPIVVADRGAGVAFHRTMSPP